MRNVNAETNLELYTLCANGAAPSLCGAECLVPRGTERSRQHNMADSPKLGVVFGVRNRQDRVKVAKTIAVRRWLRKRSRPGEDKQHSASELMPCCVHPS